MASRSPRVGLALVALMVLAVLAAMGCFDLKPADIAGGGGGVETTEGNVASLAGSPTGAASA